MASLVTEVLLQAGKLDKDGLETRVSKLTSKSSELKSKVDNYVKKKYSEFSPMFFSCQTLLSDLKEQQRQAKDIQETLAGVVKTQLRDSIDEFEHLTLEHSKTSELLLTLYQICELTDLFDHFTNNKTDLNFKKSATALTQISSLLESLKNSHLCDIGTFRFFKQHFTLLHEGMRYNLDEKWMTDISWTLPSKDGSSNSTSLKIPLMVKDIDPNLDLVREFQDFVYAMEMLSRLKPNVQRFSETLMTYIFFPLIKDQTLVPEFDRDECGNNTILKISLVKSSAGKEAHSGPTRLFHHVVEILRHLHTNLLRFKVAEDRDDTIMSVFSELVHDDLLQMLVDYCLAPTIPKSIDELENYKEVEAVVKGFESALESINFISTSGEHGSMLMAYVGNVSFNFASRRCTDILSEARRLMKNADCNTQLVNDKIIGSLSQFPKKSSKKSSEVVKIQVGTGFDCLKPGKLLSDDTLHFPECRVSSCAIDIMTLAYKTMYEASESESGCAVRLVTATQHIFDLYCTAYPVFHQDSLENLPYRSALFHNDCMYLAHHLLTFGHQFFTMSSLARKSLRVLTFVEKVSLLRRLGAECLLSQMKKQKDLMISCLEPLRAFAEIQGHKKYNAAEKAVKQILYQLNHLKKVWDEVLQEHTLQRALSKLVNSCVSELISIICGMEDISADDSISLKLICHLVFDEVPILFCKKDVKDLSWQRQVPTWLRLQEMIFLLSASLNEIVDRWSRGKGPLAAAFSTTEVKALIRALYQNTEHRAQALSKIRI